MSKDDDRKNLKVSLEYYSKILNYSRENNISFKKVVENMIDVFVYSDPKDIEKLLNKTNNEIQIIKEIPDDIDDDVLNRLADGILKED
jgi:hypothetical protein